MSQLYYPLNSKLVSEWPGPREGGSYWHYGTDFAVPVNTPLKASFDGRVVFAGGDGASGELYPGSGIWANGQGLTVGILRSDGLLARYGHMNRIDVKHGQRVSAGDIVGLSGNTGFTTGPHCHWELRWDDAWSGGAWADPRKLGAKNFPAHAAPEETQETEMLVYYAHAYGKGKPGWLVLGFTKNTLILSTQKAANQWTDRLKRSAIPTDYLGFCKYLEADGASKAQINRVSKG